MKQKPLIRYWKMIKGTANESKWKQVKASETSTILWQFLHWFFRDRSKSSPSSKLNSKRNSWSFIYRKIDQNFSNWSSRNVIKRKLNVLWTMGIELYSIGRNYWSIPQLGLNHRKCTRSYLNFKANSTFCNIRNCQMIIEYIPLECSKYADSRLYRLID